MKEAIYNGNAFPIDDDTLTPEQIREGLALSEPSIRNADYRVEGDKIIYTVKVATKG